MSSLQIRLEEQSSKKKAALLIFIIILLLTLFLIFIEVGSFFFLKIVSGKEKVKINQEEIISLPFKGAEDSAIVRKTRNGETNCPPNRLIYNKDSESPEWEIKDVTCNGAENIKSGFRVTTGQPENTEHQVHVFGGSTIWGSGSSDAFTIPSLIQRFINERGLDWRVQNYGFITFTSHQQLERLKRTQIARGDLVIFYDGGNDIWHGVVYGRPKGTIFGYNDENRIGIYINRLKFYLNTKSHFYRVLGWIKNRSQIVILCKSIAKKEIEERTRIAFEVYKANIVAAKIIVESKGGYFFHFFQPTVISRKPNSPHEINLIQNLSDDAHCGLIHMQQATEYYRRHYREIDPKINATDLSQLLQPGRSGKEYFFDWIHISSIGNKEVSASIFLTILPLLTGEGISDHFSLRH